MTKISLNKAIREFPDRYKSHGNKTAHVPFDSQLINLLTNEKEKKQKWSELFAIWLETINNCDDGDHWLYLMMTIVKCLTVVGNCIDEEKATECVQIMLNKFTNPLLYDEDEFRREDRASSEDEFRREDRASSKDEFRREEKPDDSMICIIQTLEIAISMFTEEAKNICLKIIDSFSNNSQHLYYLKKSIETFSSHKYQIVDAKVHGGAYGWVDKVYNIFPQTKNNNSPSVNDNSRGSTGILASKKSSFACDDKYPVYFSCVREIFMLHLLRNHPRVPRLVDFWIGQGHSAVIMPWYDLSLDKWCKKISKVNRICMLPTIVMDIASVLQVLHRYGYVQADIKPENILVNENSNEFFVCDWGLVQSLWGHVDDDVTTKEYMPPKYDGRKCTERSLDMWSLGCLMLEVLTANDLFDEDVQYSEITNKFHFTPEKAKKHISKYIEKICPLALTNENHDALKSSGFYDLVRGLLTTDQMKRFSIDDVLNHKYLSNVPKIDVSYLLNQQINQTTNLNVNSDEKHLNNRKDIVHNIMRLRFDDKEICTTTMIKAIHMYDIMNSCEEIANTIKPAMLGVACVSVSSAIHDTSHYGNKIIKSPEFAWVFGEIMRNIEKWEHIHIFGNTLWEGNNSFPILNILLNISTTSQQYKQMMDDSSCLIHDENNDCNDIEDWNKEMIGYDTREPIQSVTFDRTYTENEMLWWRSKIGDDLDHDDPIFR